MDYNIILGKSTLTNVSDAYSGTLNVSYSQYTNNGVYLCKIDTTNTTISPTLSLNGLTAYPIKRNDGTSILVGELKVDAWYLFMFDQSTSTFEILNLSIPYLNGTTNYVAKYTPTGNVLGLSQIFDNGTNVGIGTATPTSKLQIVGTDSTSSNYSLKVDNSASSPLLYVRNDGNVGIGTSTPSYQFTLKSRTNSNSNIPFRVTNSGETAGFSIFDNGDFSVGNNLVNMVYESSLGGSFLKLSSVNENSIQFIINGQQNSQLINSGLNSLIWRLPTNFEYRRPLNDHTFANIQSSNGDWSFHYPTNVKPYPDAKVTIYGNDNLSTGRGLTVYGFTGTTPNLIVRNDGNVGIGTSTPSEKLEVNGNIKTAQPSANGAGAWKLGKKVTATVSLITTDYIEVEIDSVVYKLALVS